MLPDPNFEVLKVKTRKLRKNYSSNTTYTSGIWNIVEFESNTTRANALVVFDSKSKITRKKYSIFHEYEWCYY